MKRSTKKKDGGPRIPRTSADPNRNWSKNEIQFPRLLAELEAVGVFTPAVMNAVALEMDLQAYEVRELLSRAQLIWDRIKARTHFNGRHTDGKF